MGHISRLNSLATLITSVGTLNSADDTAVTSVGTLTTSVGTLDSANDTQRASLGTQITSVGTLVTSVGTLDSANDTARTSLGTQIGSVGTLVGTATTAIGSVGTAASTDTESVGTAVSTDCASVGTAVSTDTASVGTLVTTADTAIDSVGTQVANLDRIVEKAADVLGGATDNLFTVTGEVLVRIHGVTTTATARAGGAVTLKVGTTDDDDSCVPSMTDARMDVSHVIGAVDQEAESGTANGWVLVSNATIVLTLDNAFDSGAITFFCEWKPLSSDGAVVAA